MLYKDLGLKMNDQTKTISIKGQNINILQYLPIRDKKDLIEIALQESKENGIVNDIKLEVLFNMYIVFFYTDLYFSDEEKDDIYQLYDELESNGILTRILGAINDDEYKYLIGYLDTVKETRESYDKSAAGVIKMFIQDLPRNATAAADLLKDVDLSKFEQVNKFAEAANGGRPISDSFSDIISSTPEPNMIIRK